MHPYKLPNLYVPGAGKSGTSTLHELLNSHPEICMSTEKEPHFWTWPNFETFSQKEFEAYAALFGEKNCKYLGESSTGYMCFPNFIERIQKYATKVPKFIFILRNPIDRLYSHYWWLKGIGSEDLNLKDAVFKDLDIEPSEAYRLEEANFKNYYQFGLYGKWIQRFYESFGKENIHIVSTENLRDNKIETLNGCFAFLGLDNISHVPDIKSNKTVLLRFPKLYKYAKIITWGDYKLKKNAKPFVPKFIRTAINKNLYNSIYKLTATKKTYPKMSEEDRFWVKNLYEEDVKLLRKISGLTFEEWKDFN